ncbi:MAG: glycoside hydrolase family 6 protein [Gordonia sp. (in: high G+C Gram-positive bacteria)]|uniref:glycoside hydrolase family 6 protein n=1 Tax=Gordonia sp. (in: high G+C Gram-positive bacteria) TaxID=84139 RepID=UPI0039E2BC84
MRRSPVVAAALAAALAVTLSACGGAADEPVASAPNQPPAGRIAPAEARYSLAATPQYFEDLSKAADEMKAFFGNYLPEGAFESYEQIRRQPVAEWIGGDVGPERISKAISASKDTIPAFVLYHIPDRDLDQYSAGGAAYGADYRKWIQSVSHAIGEHSTVVVVEPDALPHMLEMDDAAADERADLLADTLRTFAKNNPHTAVYLDAGNSAWLSPRETAQLLRRVAAKDAVVPGISLNVSNFQSEEDTRAYSEQISKAYGKPLYTIIDESRNGAPAPNRQWCNPAWARTRTSIDDRFDPQNRFEQLYIKRPGESDGVCGVSTSPAGTFDTMLFWRLLGTEQLVK